METELTATGRPDSQISHGKVVGRIHINHFLMRGGWTSRCPDPDFDTRRYSRRPNWEVFYLKE
jgi:hypothetical protein